MSSIQQETTIDLRPARAAGALVLPILLSLSLSHMLNDVIQSLLPAVYPILKENYALSFTQIGVITLVFQVTASLLQPLVGIYTDAKPQPYSLPLGMASTLIGLLTLAYAHSFAVILLGAALVGTGSSIFHPESSRMARIASGGRHGFAQSVFQIGGNVGTALGPLLAAWIILPNGQKSIAWFAAVAILAILVLSAVGRWYQTNHLGKARPGGSLSASPFDKRTVAFSVAVLIMLVFSKYFYMAAIHSYYTFYLIEKFGLSTQSAQMHLFLFLGAVAVGTFAGGALGDTFGRKRVIWGSILGVLPFTLALPYADLIWTEILSVMIGLVLASGFPAIIVYAQELLPGRPGMIGGLFFGLAFGMGGLGAAVFGLLADAKGIEYVYHAASFLPALGMLTAFLPGIVKDK